eukprot:117270_1
MSEERDKSNNLAMESNNSEHKSTSNSNSNPISAHAWTSRRKKKKRKRRAALFTKKKVRTTTSNLRIPKQQRRKLYRDRCKKKKILISKGLIQDKENMPPINHEDLDVNYPVIVGDEHKNNTN